MSFWLEYIALYSIIVGIIVLGVCVTEWWKWRKESR